MKKFNPEKELNKVQYGDRNKLIGIIVFLLVIIAIGSTYALYQVRHTKSLVYTTVSDFKKRDIYLSVLVDGKTQGDFPKNNEGKIYTGIECDKEYSEAYFDNTEWKLHFTSDGPNKCTVKFETGNLPNAPELFQGMIPIVYGDNGLMYVADTSKDWYNYQDHRWANAVLVDASNTTIKNKYFKEDNNLRDDIAGNQVLMEEVLQMYVWIPRYKYQLFNVNNGTIPKQLINIKFEKDTANTGDIVCTYTDMKNGTIKEECKNKDNQNEAQNGEWYTHPAFTFGNTQLKGIWVGKFEPSDPTDLNGRVINVINEITILPNKTSMINKSLKIAYNVELAMEYTSKYNLKSEQIDVHNMKNIDWGAVAYLSQSVYGIYKDEKTCNISESSFDECRIWVNNVVQGELAGGTNNNIRYGGAATGCVGLTATAPVEWNSDASNPAECPEGRKWNQSGIKASTTGNMYGIYDMSGGAYDYVMGLLIKEDGSDLLLDGSGFDSSIDSRYYDLYTYSNQTTDYERGHLGDATKETATWNKNTGVFPGFPPGNVYRSWFERGNYPGDGVNTASGPFTFGRFHGGASGYDTFRVVLTAQDGNE